MDEPYKLNGTEIDWKLLFVYNFVDISQPTYIFCK